ncbi:MAG: M48 family metalloprotease [Desulfobacterales bacterium]
MCLSKKIIWVFTFLAVFAGLVFPHGAVAITIAEEEELSREFMKVVFNRFSLIKDPYIVNYVNSIGQNIVKELPPQPFSYKFYIIDSEVYNAFATPAGHIFIYRGLIEAMDSEDELAGIIAHEIAHVQCRHISDKIDRSSKLNLATLAGLAAGVFLGISGADTAAQAVAVGSMATVQSLQLAYSREDEIQADKIGLGNMTRAGYDAKALMTTLNKIRSKRWFDDIPTYLSTHPAAEARIAYIDSWSQNQTDLPFMGATESFKKARTRLLALYGNESRAVSHFKNVVERNPNDVAGRYGYGLVLARIGHRQDAAYHLQAALEQNPLDSAVLGELGRIYFLDGRMSDALTALKGAIGLSGNISETLFYLGRTQMELGRLGEAVTTFNRLLKDHPDYEQAYYFLGESYGKQGNLAQAHYYLGRYYEKKRDLKNAVFHLEKALEYSQNSERKKEIENILKDARKEFKEFRKSQSTH